MGIKARAPRTEPVDVLEAGDGCGRWMGWGLPSWLVKTTDGRRGGACSRRVRSSVGTGRPVVQGAPGITDTNNAAQTYFGSLEPRGGLVQSSCALSQAAQRSPLPAASPGLLGLGRRRVVWGQSEWRSWLLSSSSPHPIPHRGLAGPNSSCDDRKGLACLLGLPREGQSWCRKRLDERGSWRWMLARLGPG